MVTVCDVSAAESTAFAVWVLSPPPVQATSRRSKNGLWPSIHPYGDTRHRRSVAARVAAAVSHRYSPTGADVAAGAGGDGEQREYRGQYHCSRISHDLGSQYCSAITAPVGSWIRATVPLRRFADGETMTWPPRASACFTEAATSATRMYGIHSGRTSCAKSFMIPARGCPSASSTK